MIKIIVSEDTIQDARNIGRGVYAPLEGFLKREDFESVRDTMRLSDGRIWSIPVVLDLSAEEAAKVGDGGTLILVDAQGNEQAVVEGVEAYPYDRIKYVQQVFGTEDIAHPGVKKVMDKKEYLAGGRVVWVAPDPHEFSRFDLSPRETREEFRKRGWNTVVAFQTRNIPHRSHEALQKMALEGVDGLFVQPVIGSKKPGDFKKEVIMACYQVLLERHYPAGKCLLGVLPMKMNYAGPREAVMHALIRRNYGCTHMIVGRDHAGVASYYDPYAAHRIFDQFSQEELGISILKFENVNYCYPCKNFKQDGTCDHGPEDKFKISGTRLRQMVRSREPLPEELVRSDIAEIIAGFEDPFVS